MITSSTRSVRSSTAVSVLLKKYYVLCAVAQCFLLESDAGSCMLILPVPPRQETDGDVTTQTSRDSGTLNPIIVTPHIPHDHYAKVPAEWALARPTFAEGGSGGERSGTASYFSTSSFPFSAAVETLFSVRRAGGSSFFIGGSDGGCFLPRRANFRGERGKKEMRK